MRLDEICPFDIDGLPSEMAELALPNLGRISHRIFRKGPSSVNNYLAV